MPDTGPFLDSVGRVYLLRILLLSGSGKQAGNLLLRILQCPTTET